MVYRFRRSRKGRSSTNPSKKRVIKKALKKHSQQKIAKVVKRVLSKQTEIKCVTSMRNITNVGAVSASSTTLVGNYLVLNPSNSSQGFTINSGTGNAQRIGNRVKTKKLVFQYSVQPKAYSASSNTILYPFIIRFYLVRSKLNPTVDPTIGQIQNQFYENGATMAGFTGEVMDLNRRVCPDTFTYLTHWDHKIGFSDNPQHGNNAFQYSANNDFKMAAYGNKDLTKHCNSTVVFDDNQLVNSPYLFLIWNIYSMGPSPYPVTQFPCFISANTQYWYTDA